MVNYGRNLRDRGGTKLLNPASIPFPTGMQTGGFNDPLRDDDWFCFHSIGSILQIMKTLSRFAHLLLAKVGGQGAYYLGGVNAGLKRD